MNFVVLSAWLVAVVYGFAQNRDPVSPCKFLLATMAIYYGELFVNSAEPLLVYGCFLGLVAIALIMAAFEGTAERQRSPAGMPRPLFGFGAGTGAELSPKRFAFLLWALTIVPLGAYAWAVRQFGGIDGYLSTIQSRVQDWRGLGIVLIFVTVLPTLNLIYFIAIITRTAFSWRHTALYLVHLSLTVLAAVASGSRSQVLNVFAVGTVLFHYLRRRVSPVTFGVAAAVLVAAAAFLGAVRDNAKYEQGQFSLTFDTIESSFRLSLFSYGVTPLRVLAQAPDIQPLFGATFLSVFTNPIPRALWENKPETGGVRFTKMYMNDQWDGLSYATPGFIGEAIMNFGQWFGVLAGFGLLLGLFLRLEVGYDRAVRETTYTGASFWSGLRLLLYIYGVQYACALLIGEFTNTTIPVLFLCGWVVLVWKLAQTMALRPRGAK